MNRIFYVVAALNLIMFIIVLLLFKILIK